MGFGCDLLGRRDRAGSARPGHTPRDREGDGRRRERQAQGQTAATLGARRPLGGSHYQEAPVRDLPLTLELLQRLQDQAQELLLSSRGRG